MIITTLDVETTFIKDHKGRTNPTPFVPNLLVSIGYSSYNTETEEEYKGYLCFNHNEEAPHEGGFDEVQQVLHDTDLLVGHNIKFDLQWLLTCNFEYEGPVYDTMVTEYLFLRSRKLSLKLVDVLKRRKLADKRTDLTEDYLSKGVGFDAMPWEVVEEYGRQDVDSTWELALAQLTELECGWEEFVV